MALLHACGIWHKKPPFQSVDGKKKAKDSLANEKGGQSAHLYFRGKTRSCPEKSIKCPTRRPAEAHAAVRHIRRFRPNHQSK